MRFLIQRSEFLRALTRGAAIAEKKASTPILTSVLLRATEGGLKLTATDKAMTYVGTFAANVETPGEVAVNAMNALQAIKALPDEVVELILADNAKIHVRCGKSVYKLEGQAAAEFPPAPSFEVSGSLSIQAADLRRIIDRTWFSIAPDDNHYGLNGAHLDAVDTPDGRMLRMVSADGNRLSWAQAPFTGNLGIGRRMLLPRKPLAEVRKMIDGFGGPVEIGFGERAAVVRFEGTTVHMRLLEAEFPNYKEVLPTNFKRRVVVERARFIESLRRVSIFASDTSHSVRFAFSETGVVLSARKLDAGDAREEADVKSFEGDPITMGFNADFLQDALTAAGEDDVLIQLGDALSPAVVTPLESADSNAATDAFFVVMAVRLD